MEKIDKIYNTISPLSLAAIVALNFLLVYMNLANLDNQTHILYTIQNNTDNVGEAVEIIRQNDELQEAAFREIQSQHQNTTKTIGEVQNIELVSIAHLDNLTKQVANNQKVILENLANQSN